jgi:hypothetical protein
MREIKTITDNLSTRFDLEVNDALKEGWELVRRECFITGSDRATTFYAELERIVVPYEAEPEIDEYEEVAHWHITKDPRLPYRCSTCLFKSTTPYAVCPSCGSLMSDDIEE